MERSVVSAIRSFGCFRLDAANHCLWRDAERVAITPKAYDVLCHLVENSGRLVTPDEMLAAVWADTYVNPEVLRKYILEIRKALGDKPDDPQFVETVPKRGYRFIAAVCSESEPAASDPAEAVTGSTTEIMAPQSAVNDPAPRFAPLPSSNGTSLTSSGELQRTGAFVKAVVPPKVVSHGMRRMIILAASVIVLLAVIGYFYLQRTTAKLTDKDTIVLADFANSTGEPVFDDTLKTALTVSLNQSPFLNVVSDDKVTTTLKLMTRPAETKLTSDVARELCQRAGSKAYIAGSIARLGTQYVLGLKAVDCQSGDTLGEEQATAAAKEEVLDALGTAASKLRRELGESLPSVSKFDVPLEQATTSSLEALQAYSSGVKINGEKGAAAALPYNQRAIELDSNFAIAYGALAGNYLGLLQLGRASQYFTTAFELREHASQREKLLILKDYYHRVTGELEKAAQADQDTIDNYPRDRRAYLDLSQTYASEGRYEEAWKLADQYRQLAPDKVGGYVQIANLSMALQRFGEVRRAIQEAHARKLDEDFLHVALYGLGFLDSDSQAMATEQRWFGEDPAYENSGLSLGSDTEAYAGRITKARELTKHAVDSAVRSDSKETGAIWWENAALREAAIGNVGEARSDAAAGLQLSPDSPSVKVQAALAYALVGDASQAQAMWRDLNQRYPLNTQVQSLWLPTITAQIAINRKDPAAGIEELQRALPPIEYGNIPFINQFCCLYSTYIRGQAMLAARQGTQAATEFQRILDHRGVVWNCWTGALARLGLARANALQLKTLQGADADAARVRARSAYKDFLTLWKDADPHIPILNQAQAEYASLQ
jgi:eukaryotic-like serine/threonine-protein kinase